MSAPHAPVISQPAVMPGETFVYEFLATNPGLTGLVATALATGAFSALAQDTVKIGLILPLTGPFASTGRQIDAAVKALTHGEIQPIAPSLKALDLYERLGIDSVKTGYVADAGGIQARGPKGDIRFEWVGGKLIQRSALDANLEWTMTLTKDTVTAGHPEYNEKAARAKLMSADGAESGLFDFGTGIAPENRAHGEEEMACFTCHLSWTTSCGGCRPETTTSTSSRWIQR